MPYPVVHIMFFVLCISLPGLFSFAQTALSSGVYKRDWWNLLLLFSIGSFFSLLPDIPAVWNFLLHGNMNHGMAGPIPTHSLVFGVVAFCSAFVLGLLAYRQRDRALALGMYAEAAFLSHLLLDDIAEGGLSYLYPFYNETMSLFSYVKVRFSDVDFQGYNTAGMVSVFFIFCVLLMALMALNYLGFGFRYEPLKNKAETACNQIPLASQHTTREIREIQVINADIAEDEY
ncbi:metal-dependent hydrolase [uncultured Methanomethylovorans sp.]|uniref:metal-dependent hydrolase n=1 Tax=uncultured Methanomethylovorans sp. TaxID=183759 RepID=UPI002AA7F941|nr:metal-dependent hydrolase [uncultured Methanomethylovorans sp.]